MIEVRLGVDDLARTRVISTLGMAFEAHFAWERLSGGGRGDGLGPWRRATRSRMRRAAGGNPFPEPVRSLLRTLTVPEPTEPGLFHTVAVAPYWGRILASLKAERDSCGRGVLAGGMDYVLNSRHPDLSWESPVLRIRNGQPSREVDLSGLGMTLAPSLFVPQPLLIDAEYGWEGLPVLVYNIDPGPEEADALWYGDEGEPVLRALLGRTRADILDSLREAHSTGEVADRLGISSPSASKHLTVLRRAGFIATRRRQNSTLHTLTPLGEAILG
ncbi:ArsR/SmtB family transcription factor [Streptomyces vinaceus]|uniref:ArsR/SmtB family transcription factor n=1 Tax=Streptomyces vinaceus TaxID=1960 RepID=UPI00368ADFF0